MFRSPLMNRPADFLSTEAEAEDISNRQWTFTAAIARQNPEFVDLSPLLDEAVLQLRKEVPLQLVVEMFKKMVRDEREVIIRLLR